MSTIDEIVSLAPKSSTVRIVYLNGNVDKAVIQDAKRERSGGEKFVRDYASKIEKVWGELLSCPAFQPCVWCMAKTTVKKL